MIGQSVSETGAFIAALPQAIRESERAVGADILVALTLGQNEHFLRESREAWEALGLQGTWYQTTSRGFTYVGVGAAALAGGLAGAGALGITELGTVALSTLPSQFMLELWTLGATGSPFAYRAMMTGRSPVVQQEVQAGAQSADSVIEQNIISMQMENASARETLARSSDTYNTLLQQGEYARANQLMAWMERAQQQIAERQQAIDFLLRIMGITK